MYADWAEPRYERAVLSGAKTPMVPSDVVTPWLLRRLQTERGFDVQMLSGTESNSGESSPYDTYL